MVEVTEECWCDREEEEEDSRDLVATGLIDPRHLGRIVNRGCAKGWRRVCGRQGREEEQQAFLFQGGLQGAPDYSGIGPRVQQEGVEIDPRTLPKRQLEDQDSKVAFPVEE